VVDQAANPAAPNRIDLPGTAEESWAAWAGLRHLAAADPLDWPSAVIVAVLAHCAGLGRLVRHTEPDFLAELHIRTDGTPVSVAQATGLV
jgi:hypothetical protein